jgi:zinc transport system substrate-binding protein
LGFKEHSCVVCSVLVVGLMSRLGACSESGDDGSSESGGARVPLVHAVNRSLMYSAVRNGGDRVDVRRIAPPDEDPAFWEPTDEQITALQSADLALLNGAGSSKWRRHVSLPEARTLDTSRAVKSDLIRYEEGMTHSNGANGNHSHVGTAVTTWIDMRQARHQAEATRDSLVELATGSHAEIQANAAASLADLLMLDAGLDATAASIGVEPLSASHHVYQYLARRCGRSVRSVLWEPGITPDAAVMAGLAALLSEHKAVWMIWETEAVAETDVMLEAVGVRSVAFDPCANRPDEGDWLGTMCRNVSNMKAIGR